MEGVLGISIPNLWYRKESDSHNTILLLAMKIKPIWCSKFHPFGNYDMTTPVHQLQIIHNYSKFDLFKRETIAFQHPTALLCCFDFHCDFPSVFEWSTQVDDNMTHAQIPQLLRLSHWIMPLVVGTSALSTVAFSFTSIVGTLEFLDARDVMVLHLSAS